MDVLGAAERNLKMIRESFGVKVSSRDGVIQLRGSRRGVQAARSVVDQLVDTARRRRPLSQQQLRDTIADAGRRVEAGDFIPAGPNELPWGNALEVYAQGRRISATTENQQAYLDGIRDSDLTIGIGPAGTGKTYLAVAAAVHLLRTERVRKAVLARPAVEAGEKLGFLPGDQFAKVNPYLRPLLDALNDMMDFTTLKNFMASDVIEVVPLAFMRGRTLNNAIIILDEAQNTTRGQMQMFLTRMGRNSRMIITGDPTQIDLPDPTQSGLIDAVRRLRRTNGVSICPLEQEDVVRHDLVQRIIQAYADPNAPRSERMSAWIDAPHAPASRETLDD